MQLPSIAKILGDARALIWRTITRQCSLRKVYKYRIAGLTDYLRDVIECYPKAIHQRVATVSDVRYRSIFANVIPAVRRFL
ncbi:hypothetical protein DPMN_093188 [Dreissena polymorpha]|uniref:Uncharacterized protein n=1 Tax=Dreissena polymorpha TaxID=45954 RepID=A0A9D4L2I6_DREPO|nr:hypothetical protein DPMN_093188 [Dreissena polymorpha]